MPGALQLWKSVGDKGHSTFDTSGDVPIMYTDTSNTNPGVSPIPIPSTPTDSAYSAETWLFAKVSLAPANQIDNLRFWGPGSNRQDDFVVMWVGTSVSSAGVGADYGPPKEQGAISTAAVFDGSSALAYTGPSDNLVWDDYSTLTSIGDTSGHLVLQLEVGSLATLGTLSNENTVFHYSYSES